VPAALACRLSHAQRPRLWLPLWLPTHTVKSLKYPLGLRGFHV
jgi:hypothetical protein